MIAPSILSADLLNLGQELADLEKAGANRIHVDVMDGRFVPNISFGIPVVQAVRRGTRLPVEVHLMIVEPEKYLEAFAKAGADTLIIHQEVSPHLDRSVQMIKQLGKKAGVAINPGTPSALLEEIIEQLDLALVMTVNPGFGGQHFIRDMLTKIEEVQKMLKLRNHGCELEVDGGIDGNTASEVAKAGAGVLVVGSALFVNPGQSGQALQKIYAASGLTDPD